MPGGDAGEAAEIAVGPDSRTTLLPNQSSEMGVAHHIASDDVASGQLGKLPEAGLLTWRTNLRSAEHLADVAHRAPVSGGRSNTLG